jgi:hypothetical protein
MLSTFQMAEGQSVIRERSIGNETPVRQSPLGAAAGLLGRGARNDRFGGGERLGFVATCGLGQVHAQGGGHRALTHPALLIMSGLWPFRVVLVVVAGPMQ